MNLHCYGSSHSRMQRPNSKKYANTECFSRNSFQDPSPSNVDFAFICCRWFQTRTLSSHIVYFYSHLNIEESLHTPLPLVCVQTANAFSKMRWFDLYRSRPLAQGPLQPHGREGSNSQNAMRRNDAWSYSPIGMSQTQTCNEQTVSSVYICRQ